jgi:hypothetical protein
MIFSASSLFSYERINNMSKYKFNKCVREISDEIFKKSTSMRMYNLGYACGMVNMFRAAKSGLSASDESSVLKYLKGLDEECGDYINKMLDAYDAENSKIDNLAEAYEEYDYIKSKKSE